MRASALPIYYGWFVLAAGLVPEMLAQGATSYAAGLFVLPLQAEFGLSRADASSAVLILFAGAALASPFVGRLLDRHSIRRVMAAGAVLFALSLAAIAVTTSLWLIVLLLFLPAAFGFMAIGPLATATLASRWFQRRRGLALGIAAVATSGGGLLVPLLAAAIARYGWRHALLVEAIAICAIIVTLVLLVLRDSPAAVGLERHPENQGRAPALPVSPRWRDILASAAFWIPSLALASISGTAQAAVTLIVPYAEGMGHSAAAAAFLVSAFALAAAITKVLAGMLADHADQRLLLVAAAFAMTLSWAILSLAAGYGFLLAAICLAGIALGFALPTVGSLIASHFGAERFGRVMGGTYFLILLFVIAAVRAAGFAYDIAGSYQRSFQLFAALLGCLLVAVAVFAAKARAR